MIKWLPSIIEAKRWPRRLGERFDDASVKAAASINGGAVARGGGGVNNVN